MVVNATREEDGREEDARRKGKQEGDNISILFRVVVHDRRPQSRRHDHSKDLNASKVSGNR